MWATDAKTDITDTMKKEHLKCITCGREMDEVFDNLAKEYTGYLWTCAECMPKEVIVSKG